MRHCVNDVRKGRQFLRRPMYRPAIPTAPKCGLQPHFGAGTQVLLLLNRGPMTIFKDKLLTRTYSDEDEHYALSNVLSPRDQVFRPDIYMRHHEKTGYLNMQKQRHRSADQRLCFRYMDSTIPLLPKSEISSIQPSSIPVQPSLCGTRSKTQRTGFLKTKLIN